jgi:restriction system protein
MVVPDFQSLMLPILRLSGDGKERAVSEARERLATELGLTESDRQDLLPSGRQSKFANRVAWAIFYLRHAGLLVSERRAHFRITSRGHNVLKSPPARIDIRFLEQYPEFAAFHAPKGGASSSQAGEVAVSFGTETPEEALEAAYARLKAELAVELLDRVRAASPAFFEKTVVELLLKMGYGGSRKEAGRAIGRSGDGGIDGVIDEDRLGLDSIYVQAKRWTAVVGRPDVQKFVGALHGRHAKKGVMITTSGFSPEALDYVRDIDSKVVLIDGGQLADLMIEHDVGVAATGTYYVKRTDSDYFDEE